MSGRWLIFVTSTFGRLRQDNFHEFQTSLDCQVKHCLPNLTSKQPNKQKEPMKI